MGEVITKQFAEGVSVVPPSTLAKIANKFANYANDGAFVTANGTAVAGNAYWNTTEKALRVYNGAAWEWYYGTNKLKVSCLNAQTDTDISGFIFAKASIHQVIIDVSVFRRTDTQSFSQNIRVVLINDLEGDVWLGPITQGAGDISGVTFSIHATTGQVAYSSTNLTGGNYSGDIRITNIRLIKVAA